MTHGVVSYRMLACVFVLGMGGTMLLGCAAKRPMVLEETGEFPLEGNEIDEIAETPTATVTEESKTPPSGDPRIERLEADIAKLQVEAAKVREQVNALNSRVERVETSVNVTTQQMTERFANFDAELTRIRDTMAKPKETPKPARDKEAEVALAVDAWRQAWQQKDLDTYMRLYHPHAQIVRTNVRQGGKYVERQMTSAELRSRMAAIMRNYARMEVIVRDFRVAVDGNRMVATFLQEFTAWTRPRDMKPTYMDKGLKTLVFVPSNGGWQIISESWTPTN